MSSVQDFVNLSLTLAGRLGAGRSAGIAESQVALGIANNLIDSWATRRLSVYNIVATQYQLTGGTPTYSMGPGGTLTGAARPVKIESANMVVSVEGSTARFPLKIVGQKEWASLETYGDQSIMPKLLYNDCAFPTSNISLFPTPATSSKVELYVWAPFSQFIAPSGTVSTSGTAVTQTAGIVFDPSWAGQAITINGVAYTIATVNSPTSATLTASAGTQTGVTYGVSVFLGITSFPPGYARALSYNAAIEIAPAFGLPIPASVAAIAASSKNSIEALNAALLPKDELAELLEAEAPAPQASKK